MRTPLPEKSPEHTDYLDIVKKQNMIIDYLKEREEVEIMVPMPSKAGESGGGGGAGAFGDAYHPINVGLKNTRPDESPLSPPPVTTIEETLREAFYKWFTARKGKKDIADWWEEILTNQLQKAREQERERAIEIIKDELRTSPIEVQMTKGIVFASIVGRIQSELDQPIINN